MNIVLIRPEERGESDFVYLVDDRARHIREVLNKKPGAPLRIGLLNGPLGEGIIEAVDEKRVTLRCHWSDALPTRPSIDLLIAMPRPKVLKRLWAQLAALGVGRVLITNASKVERYYFDTHVLDPEFYDKQLVEGLQQAGDTVVPEVTVHRQFKVLIEDELDGCFPDGDRLVLDPDSPERFDPAARIDGRLLLAIGPEGGWTPYEVGLLRDHRFQPLNMGARTLRSDTACIAAITLAKQMFRRREPQGQHAPAPPRSGDTPPGC